MLRYVYGTVYGSYRTVGYDTVALLYDTCTVATVALLIARAGTLLTKCMREVNLSYKSASRLLNPNMICEFPLLFCMGPIQNVFTP